MNTQTAILVTRLLDLLISGAVVGAETMARTQVLVQEGRDPTPEEWAALDAELADARRRLHADGPDGTIDGVSV